MNYLKKFIKSFFEKRLYNLGLSHILNIREKYNSIKNINHLDYKIYSQNGEDGIIDYLLCSLNILKPKFIEIGVGDYSESNTRFFFERTSAKGLIVDCIDDLNKKVSQNIKLWKGDLNIVEKKITSENIVNLLKKENFLDNIDFFSIDIDGIDYWVIKEMPKNFSKIVVLEYNSTFGPNLEITVPNLIDFDRTNYHYSNLCYGMSITAAINLMKEKNFYFIGTNLLRNNAFFISNDFNKSEYFKNLVVENLHSSTESNLRESRDKKGNLSLLSSKSKIDIIKDCDVIDLSKNEKRTIKIKDLI
tara:strand:- start:26 stop:934 length:909 start_codon:yes stop_codon:yes gene_type:complete